MILGARDRIRLVMIHVARGHNQYWFLLRCDYLSQSRPQLRQHLKLCSAQCNRQKAQFGLTHLKKWELHLGPMLSPMRRRILLQGREALFQGTGKLRVDGNFAERRLPASFAHHSQGSPHACMVRAQRSEEPTSE